MQTDRKSPVLATCLDPGRQAARRSLLVATSAVLFGLAGRAVAAPAAAPAAVPAMPMPMAGSDHAFAAQMGQAMDRMDRGMAAAPMNGDPDHDFLSMMIPHHQGAVDMAQLVLLHGRNPHIRNLAEGIIAEQENEIQIMRHWLVTLPLGGGTTK